MNINAYRAQLHKAILEEAMGQALPELNEPGWQSLGGTQDQISGLDRVRVNQEARRYYHTDPNVRHMVQLRNSYTFGRGVSLRVADSTVDEYLQEAFWNHPLNRNQISRAAAQHALNRDMQLQGELFFLLLTSRVTGRVIVRAVHPERIKRVIYRDQGTAIGYVYTLRTNSETHEMIMPDFRFDGDDRAQAQVRPHFGTNTNVAMMHVIGNPFESTDGQIRGISPLSTSIPYAKALKGFMEDRATLTIALATFAFRMTVKGNRQAVARVRDQWNSYESSDRYYPQADGRERRQGANTYIANDSTELQQLKTDSGAHNAYQDLRMFRQMAGIGQGVFEPFMGDAGNANLATATAMNTPMKKQYEFEQQFWQDVYSDMGTYALTQGFRFRPDAMRDGTRTFGRYTLDMSTGYPLQMIESADDVDLSIDVLFPPIVESDVATYSNALESIARAQATSGREMLPPEAMARTALRVFGQNADMNRYLQEMEDRDYMPEQPAPEPEPQSPPPAPDEGGNDEGGTEEDVAEADVGKPLAKNDAERVGRITKGEMNAAFDEWAALPTLEEFAKQLGFDSAEDLDNA